MSEFFAHAVRRRSRTVGAATALFLTGVVVPTAAALAQTAIDPGTVSRETELAPPFDRDRLPVTSDALAVPVADLPASVPIPEEAQAVTVTEWRFAGNTIFEADRLQAVLADRLGQALTFGQIEAAAGDIAAFYADEGYLAQVSLPPQEVTGGTVLIRIEEARFGGVEFEGSYPQQIDAAFVERHFTSALEPGTPIRTTPLDRSLLLANDLPGVSLTGVFAPGRNPGETVLVLKTTDDPVGRALVSVDNLGSRSTGEERANVQVTLLSPLHLGDFLQGTVTISEGLRDARARYSVPLGSSGLRATARVNALGYEIVAPEFSALDSEGSSLEYGAGLTYPLLRGRDANLAVSLDHDRKRLENDVLGTEVSDYQVNQTTLGVNGTLFDDLGGGGASALGVSYSHGNADGRNAAGRFDRDFDVFRLAASRQQYLTDTTTLFVSFSGQKGPEDLDSSESFSLGGPLGVRAYPTGEGSGPSGYVASAEVRQRLFDDFTLKGFVDYGHVFDRTAAGEPSSYALKGGGVSLVWDAPYGFRGDLTYARRFGDNPNPLSNGKDQDGSLHENRVWFSLSKAF